MPQLSVAIASGVTFTNGVSLTQTLATFTDALLSETSGQLQATISWGDGSSSAGVVSGSAGVFVVSGTHAFTASAGTLEVTVVDTVTGASASTSTAYDARFKTVFLPEDAADVTVGPDGNLWLTSQHELMRCTTAGAVTAFPSPAGNQITVGPDGNLWVAGNNEVLRFTTAGALTEFPLPTTNVTAGGIAAGPDGNLWFTERATTYVTIPYFQKLGRITPSGTITEFDLPTANSGTSSITAGSDGNLWFGEESAIKVGKITTNGAITEFSLTPSPGEPHSITSGPDGNLWFVGATHVVRLTPTGTFTAFEVGYSNYRIAPGPDGRLWFTQSGANGKIQAISTQGVAAEPIQLINGMSPGDIVTGPDQAIWFTLHDTTAIVRYVP